MEVSPKAPGLTHSPIAGTLNAALYSFYRSHAAGAVALVVPEHTREALFQLSCDLRANTPKDARFLRRHAKALMPRTLTGWLALASAFGFTFSAFVALACTTALLSLAGVWAAVGLAIAAGTFLGCVLSVIGISLFVAAVVSGVLAAGALSAYAAASVALGCLRLAKHLLLGAARTLTLAPADARSGAPPAPALAPAFSQYQEQQQPALPPLRTKPVSRNSPAPGPASGGGQSPVASPRKAHPAAAGAAVALAETSAASKPAPSTPAAAHGGSVLLNTTSEGSASVPSSVAPAVASTELSKGMPNKPATAAADAHSPPESGTSPNAASRAPCTPSVADEPAEATQQRNSVVAAS
ncbi:hypothetical protein ABPG77_003667 [Micractinium sp. CCAP 211/92]